MSASGAGAAVVERARQVSGAVLGPHEQFKHIRLLAFLAGGIVVIGILAAAFSSLNPAALGFGALIKSAGFIAVILDVYAGIALFSAWVWFREDGSKHKLPCIGWILLFICTGNIGTAIYMFRAASRAEGDFETLLFGGRRFEFTH